MEKEKGGEDITMNIFNTKGWVGHVRFLNLFGVMCFLVWGATSLSFSEKIDPINEKTPLSESVVLDEESSVDDEAQKQRSSSEPRLNTGFGDLVERLAEDDSPYAQDCAYIESGDPMQAVARHIESEIAGTVSATQEGRLKRDGYGIWCVLGVGVLLLFFVAYKGRRIVARYNKRGDLNATTDNDGFYQKAYEELECMQIDKVLWVKILAQTNGNESKARALYIKNRVKALKASEEG